MMMKKNGRLFLLFGSILLAVGGIVLGGLQYRWINHIAETEKDRIYLEMKKNTVQALGGAGDEVRLLVSLFQGARHSDTPVQSTVAGIGENIRYWKENASYPRLLKAAYVQVFDGTNRLYSFEDGGLQPRKLPEHLSFLEHAQERYHDIQSLQEEIVRMSADGILLIPSVGFFKQVVEQGKQPVRDTGKRPGESTGENEPSRTEEIGTPEAGTDSGEQESGYVLFYICELDLQFLFGTVLPDYVEHYLSGYPYRITDPATGTLFASSRADKHASRPELRVPIQSPVLASEQRIVVTEDVPADDTFDSRENESGTASEEVEVRQNPVVRFWFRKTAEPFGMFSVRGINNPIAEVEIYYPEKTIDATVSARRSANLVVSTGIIGILVISFFTMARLYLRAGKLREKEQEFVASISHELRTPITVIKSTSNNLAHGVVHNKERVSTYGEIIQTQAERLARMVEGILTYSGLSSGRKLVQDEVDLAPFIREIVESLQETARKAGAEITFSMEDGPGTIHTSPQALRLVVENLLINAIRHGLPEDDGDTDHPGRIFLSVNSAPLNRAGGNERAAGKVIIRVEDRGEGVSKEELDTIFKPFVRGKRASEHQHPGSGLGLHLVTRVLSSLGGTVRLESPYTDRFGLRRSGCRFICEIPYTLS